MTSANSSKRRRRRRGVHYRTPTGRMNVCRRARTVAGRGLRIVKRACVTQEPSLSVRSPLHVSACAPQCVLSIPDADSVTERTAV